MDRLRAQIARKRAPGPRKLREFGRKSVQREIDIAQSRLRNIWSRQAGISLEDIISVSDKVAIFTMPVPRGIETAGGLESDPNLKQACSSTRKVLVRGSGKAQRSARR